MQRLHRLTRRQILDQKVINNVVFKQEAKEGRLKCFGMDDPQTQFNRDFVEREYRVEGHQHLGMNSETAINGLQAGQLDVPAILEGFFPDEYKTIIAAHSQHPSYIAISAILHQMNEVTKGRITATDPQLAGLVNRTVNLSRGVDKKIHLTIELDGFGLSTFDPDQTAIMPCMFKSSFVLVPNKGKPYYELEYIETDNEHLYKLLCGEEIDADEIIRTYFNNELQKLQPQVKALSEQLAQVKDDNLRIAELERDNKVNKDLLSEKAKIIQGLENQIAQLKRDVAAQVSAKQTAHANVEKASAALRDHAAIIEKQKATIASLQAELAAVRASSLAIEPVAVRNVEAERLQAELNRYKAEKHIQTTKRLQKLIDSVAKIKSDKKLLLLGFINHCRAEMLIHPGKLRVEMLQEWNDAGEIGRRSSNNPIRLLAKNRRSWEIFQKPQTKSIKMLLEFIGNEPIPEALRQLMRTDLADAAARHPSPQRRV